MAHSHVGSQLLERIRGVGGRDRRRGRRGLLGSCVGTGGANAGRSDRWVQLVDVFATVLDVIGSPAPEAVDLRGQSLARPGGHELYDLAADPGETKSLYDTDSERAAEMEQRFGDARLDRAVTGFRAHGVPVGSTLLDDWIRSRYRRVGRFGIYEVLAPRSPRVGVPRRG